MALQFNSFSANSMTVSLRNYILAAGVNQRIRIYPDSVVLPSSPINNAANVPAGHIAEFSNLTTTVSNAVITISSGNTTVATTAAGNVAWFAIYTTANANGALTSNSISLTGGNGIVKLNTLSPTSGQLLTISLALKIVG